MSNAALYLCSQSGKRIFESRERTAGAHLSLFIETDDRNRLIYHNHSDESGNYQLLLRVLREQAVQEEDGSYRLRTKKTAVWMRPSCIIRRIQMQHTVKSGETESWICGKCNRGSQ